MSPIKEHDIKEANRSGNYAIPISGGKPSKTTHPGLKCPKIGHGALTQHTNDISNTPNSSGESWSRGPGIAKIVGYNTPFGRVTGVRSRIETKLGRVVPSTK